MPNGAVFNEGDVQVAVQPFEISFRAMLPKPLRPQTCWYRCACRTRMSRISVRMKSQYTLIGQAG
jgi:hypothetical protein